MSDLVTAFQGPEQGADRAVLLAHGAGAGMDAPALVVVADALEGAGIPSLRFEYPYRSVGRRSPDRPSVLEAATRAAALELSERSGVPAERLVLGGRSMGGRYCSMIVGDQSDPVLSMGLLLLGYPLHPAGKPERRRDEHFPRLACPVMFVSGTRDSLAPQAGLTEASAKVAGPVSFHWLEAADHGFKPLKASGLSVDEVLTDVADTSVAWVKALAR